MSLKSLIPFSRSGSPSRAGYEVDPFAAMRRDMDRLFDDMWKRLGGGSGLPAVFDNGSATPRVDLKETATGIEVSVELPGVDEKDLELRPGRGYWDVGPNGPLSRPASVAADGV